MSDDLQPAPAALSARSFLRELFTEKNNQTADLKRVLWAAGFLWALGMESWTVLARGASFDLVTAGLGLGGLLAAGGATLALNRKNESGDGGPAA